MGARRRETRVGKKSQKSQTKAKKFYFQIWLFFWLFKRSLEHFIFELDDSRVRGVFRTIRRRGGAPRWRVFLRALAARLRLFAREHTHGNPVL